MSHAPSSLVDALGRLLAAGFWLTLVVLAAGTVWLLGIQPTPIGRLAVAGTAVLAAVLDLAGVTPLRTTRARVVRARRRGGDR
jgi:hypothetical protein